MLRRLLPLFLFTSLTAAECPWPSHIEFDGRLGSYREGAGVVVWNPICQRCNRVTFVQAQAGNYRDLWTGNVGIGHRQLFCPNLAWGVNAFGDVSYSSSGHVYGQGSVGIELLGKCWEGRANGYFNGSRAVLEENIVEDSLVVNGTNVDADFFSEFKEELAYYGFDAEVGRGICFEHGQLWGYAGGYYFYDRKAKEIYGPRVRLEYQLDNPLCWYGTRLTVAGEYFYDPVHKSEGSLVVWFRIPLCKRAYRRSCMPCDSSCLSVCRQMGNRVRREPTVWVERIDRREFRETVLAQLLFVDARLTPDLGTQTDPTSLQDAVNRAGEGDYIFLLNNAAHDPINGGAGILVMQPDQTVLGFGDSPSTTIDFGPFGVLTITDLIAAPHRATLEGGTGDLITLADRATVRGIQIQGNGADNGISGTGVDDILLFDIEAPGSTAGIRDVVMQGILLTQATNPTLMDISVASVTGGNGIAILSSTGATLDTISVDDTTGDGILFNMGSNHTLSDITIDEATGDALNFTSINSASVSTAAITTDAGTTDAWLRMDSNTGTFTFDDVTFGPSSLVADGVVFGSNGATTTFTNSVLNQTDGNAVIVVTNSAPIDMTGLTIDYTGMSSSSPIVIVLSTAPISFGTASLTAVSALDAGVELNTNSGPVSFASLTIGVTGADMIGIEAGDQTGLFTVTAGVVTAADGPALSLTNTNTALTFSTLTSTSSAAQGINYVDVTGNTLITSGTITDADLAAIRVFGGDPMLNYQGSITNTMGDFITVEDTTGGVVTVQNAGGGQTIVATGGNGVVVDNAQGTVQIFDSSITGLTSDDSFTITDSNEVVIRNFATTTTPAMALAVNATDVSVLTLEDGTITVPGANMPPNVISVVNTNTPGTIAFDSVAITATTISGDAIFIHAADNSEMLFDVTGTSSLTATSATNGIHVLKSGTAAGSSMIASISGYTGSLTGATDVHIFFEGDATLTNGTYNGAVSTTTLSGAVLGGILADIGGTSTAATFDFAGNTISDVTGIAITADSRQVGTGNTYVVRAQMTNSFIDCNEGVTVEAFAGTTARISSIITDNIYTNAGVGATGYSGVTNATFTGTFCMNLSGNTSNATTGILLIRPAGSGIFSVAPTSAGSIAADLATANPGVGPITFMPSVAAFTAAGSCPIPPSPGTCCEE